MCDFGALLLLYEQLMEDLNEDQNEYFDRKNEIGSHAYIEDELSHLGAFVIADGITYECNDGQNENTYQ